MTLTKKIIIYMIVGAVVGIIINTTGLMESPFVGGKLVGGVFYVVGKVFLYSLQMLVVPLVFVSLFCGTAALKNPAMLGKIGGKTLTLYLITTGIAITIALSLASVIQPGAGFDLPTDVQFSAKQAPPFVEVLIGLVPRNPVQAMADGNMLQIIIFSILLGLAATMAGEPGKRVISFFEDFNVIIMKLVKIVMELAPYAVFALIAKVFAEIGIDAIKNLSKYFFTLFFILVLHALVVYPVLLTTLAKLNPLTFLSKMRTAMTFAFGTASSNATIPVSMRTVTERMGVSKSIGSFSIPFGATINMDGTAIMQGVATVFIAQAYGIDLTLSQLVTVVMMSIMASIGTAGVPGVGLIMLATVLTQVGLPVEGIGIIIGVDRLLDMTRTVVNITGDCAVTCIVAKSEGKLDERVFNDPDAGVIEEEHVY
ncbi:MAG TPA: dicarboxylate/amino acid:cation symporter [Gammaproteobacteria bacterium]|nr:dicarboxylate/amino acid:cation symporter [Xanthomonadales bacterium]HOP21447.1 dicarboxylate/amino acid:cation symporter [Gammaproteobacteria bacterium]MCB1594612.1 dicarboxylate/amino acid:cation symporter [Xanthomonadales bacterium]MCB1604547.1 dicarboxylate/amino acid:cation symporter [Xanthomonadales bacterium]HPI94643.1 dicarboxylate/amino acid:cation symporter [Gammaproteobacteria bacterium]